MKHSRQRGIYMSAPPISSCEEPATVLKVKLAFAEQILQIAESFLTFSQSGMSLRMFAQPFFSYVPFSADIMTTFPAFAAVSENSTTYWAVREILLLTSSKN